MIFGKHSSSSSSTSSSPSSNKFSGFLSSLKDGRSAFQLQLKDRVSAGKALAMVLKTGRVVKRNKKKENDLIVLGIPRGGVIVADVVAGKLDADYFDIVIPRKLRAPDNKENAIGAISQDGSIVYLDEFMVSSLKVPSEYIEREKTEQLEEIKRRTALYKRRPSPSSSPAAAPSSFPSSLSLLPSKTLDMIPLAMFSLSPNEVSSCCCAKTDGNSSNAPAAAGTIIAAHTRVTTIIRIIIGVFFEPIRG